MYYNRFANQARRKAAHQHNGKVFRQWLSRIFIFSGGISMSGKIAPLAFAVSLLCLAACGGGGGGNAAADNPPANNPAPQPSVDAQDKARFEASKYSKTRVPMAGEPYQVFDELFTKKTRVTSANGHIIEGRYEENGVWVDVEDYRSLPQGFASLSAEEIDEDLRSPLVMRSYQGFVSGVWVTYSQRINAAGVQPVRDSTVYGAFTSESDFPKSGKATYNGTAFDYDGQGKLIYHVDFAKNKGYGEIGGLPRYGTVTLHENQSVKLVDADGVSHVEYQGAASNAQGALQGYKIDFAGKQAAEMVGTVNVRRGERIGFHGTRGEITE